MDFKFWIVQKTCEENKQEKRLALYRATSKCFELKKQCLIWTCSNKQFSDFDNSAMLRMNSLCPAAMLHQD